MKKTLHASLAFFTAVILLLGCLPLGSFAVETAEGDMLSTPVSSTSQPSGLLTSSAEVMGDTVIGAVAEVTALREENVKHYRLSNGTYEAVSFPYAVHYRDAEGIWQSIDHSLALANAENKQVYSTADARIRFAERFEWNTPLFTLEENGYSVSMAWMTGTTDTPQISEGEMQLPVITNGADATATVFASVEEAIEATKTASSIRYPDVKENTSLVYELRNQGIKENIIVAAPCDSYEYVFQMTLSGLTAELMPNKSILLCDEETEKEIYRIPAPYMYDAAGNISTDVTYELLQVKSGMYLLRVVAEATWINADTRSYPVVIDPYIEYPEWVQDAFTYSAVPYANMGSDTELLVSSVFTTYIQTNIPALPQGSSVVTARMENLRYYFEEGASGSATVDIDQLTGAWDEDSITEENSPGVVSQTVSLETLYTSSNIAAGYPGTASFVITSAAQSWYSTDGANNYGIRITWDSGTVPIVVFCSREVTEFSTEPYVRVNYAYQIPDGVYAIRNELTVNSWLTVANDDIHAGGTVTPEHTTTNPASESVFDRSSMFKITKAGSRYIVRSMLNNNLGLAVVNGNIVMKEIPSLDSDVAEVDKCDIAWDGMGFILCPGGTTNALGYNHENDELFLGAPEQATSRSHWCFEGYTGTNYYGVTLEYSGDLQVGETVTINPYCWSTVAVCFEPELAVATGFTDHATLTWNLIGENATVALHKHGELQLYVFFHQEGMDYSISITESINVTLEYEEGVFLFKNKGAQRYMQLSSPQNYQESGEILELHSFNSENCQYWELIHYMDGYYIIKSVRNDYVVSVQANKITNENAALIQDVDQKESRQLWKISQTSSGAYKFQAKSAMLNGTEWCMSGGDGIVANGLNVEQKPYTNNTNYLDEWILELPPTTASVMLCGIPDTTPGKNHDHKTSLEDIASKLYAVGLCNNYKVFREVTAEEALSYLKTYNIFTSRSHGNVVIPQWETEQQATFIMLNDANASNESVYLLSHNCDASNQRSVDISDTDDFSNLDLAIFIACNTGVGGETGKNLPARVVELGAGTAIGFNYSISCGDSTVWCNAFYDNLMAGMTVDEALTESEDAVKNDRQYMFYKENITICGNRNYRLGDGRWGETP